MADCTLRDFTDKNDVIDTNQNVHKLLFFACIVNFILRFLKGVNIIDFNVLYATQYSE